MISILFLLVVVICFAFGLLKNQQLEKKSMNFYLTILGVVLGIVVGSLLLRIKLFN